MADPDQEARRQPDPTADGSCHGSTATEAKESGDAQSSACLTNRWSLRRRKETLPEKEVEGCPIAVETTKIESQPLMSFLEIITSDKLCSVFMRKLESQVLFHYYILYYYLIIIFCCLACILLITSVIVMLLIFMKYLESMSFVQDKKRNA